MKKGLSIILVLSVLFTLFTAMPMSVSAELNLPTETVGEDVFYLIGSADDYIAFVNYVNTNRNEANADTSHLAINGKLTADIDMTIKTIPRPNDMSIGRYDSSASPKYYYPYTGTFDGNGHVIRNLSITRSLGADNNKGVGMFNATEGATIKDLGVESATIYNSKTGRANSDIGGIISYGKNTTLQNCYIKNSRITRNGASASDYIRYAGAIAAYLSGSTVTNCYSIGNTVGYEKVYAWENGNSISAFIGNAGTTSSVTYSYAKNVELLNDNGKNYAYGFIKTSTDGAFPTCYTDNNVKRSSYYHGANYKTEDWDTQAFVDTLNNSGTAWKADTYGVNGGAPRLSWEEDHNFISDSGDYYEIATANDLVKFKYLVNSLTYASSPVTVNARLTADIDMNTATIAVPADMSIGTFNYSKRNEGTVTGTYGGTFDGDNHIIENLSITRELGTDATNSGIALFAFTKGATIKNLGIDGATVTNTSSSKVNYYGGVLVCYAASTTVQNCFVKNSTLVRNNADPTADSEKVWQYAGPIGGQFTGTCTIENCYSINNSVGFDTACTTGGAGIGGFAGFINNTATVTNCYSKGINWLNATGFQRRFSFARTGVADTVFTNCYTDDNYILASLAASASNAATYVDPVANWTNGTVLTAINGGSAYKENVYQGAPSFVWELYSGGKGTSANPYIISTADDLRAMATKLNGTGLTDENEHYEGVYFSLANDINMSGESFTPIAEVGADKTLIGGTNERSFRGTFSGNGHVIRNLSIDISGRGPALFGILKNATVTNLGIESSTFRQQGNYRAAALAIYADSSTISGCYAKNCTITIKSDSGNPQEAGGLIARAYGTTSITNCYVNGITIRTQTDDRFFNSAAGGIAGYLGGTASISNCYAVEITFTKAGSNIANAARVYGSATISNCYVTGTKGKDTAASLTVISPLDKMHGLFAGDAFIPDYENVNGGYPYLSWENFAEPTTHTVAWTGATVNGSNQITAVKLWRHADAPNAGTVYLATYNGDELTGFAKGTITSSAAGEEIVSLDDSVAKAGTIKAFVWNASKRPIAITQ